ncbi:MAG: ATP-binding cassette domain-containing protein [Clostridiales bacterium]|nr:ATP-binding cassette domain-containing protein [Clostridiales bacterium]
MSIFVDIEKSLGSFDLKMKFEAGNETLALLGASGCGKSMTLKCIAGIERPDKGRIVVDDVVLFDSEKHIDLSPQERHVGLMFQNYALFPNMTVLQNIRAGAKRERNKAKRDASVRQIMESFKISELAGRYPSQISGGQQQRVAMARILISAPNILLLDEPFSALDSHLRFHMEQEVRKVIHDFGKTVLMVSHDRDEVFRMSDSIAVINNGCVEAFGSKENVFSNPETKTGAMLTGCKNISRVEKLENGRVYAADWGVELNISRDMPDMKYVGIRMHYVRLGKGENAFRCSVVEEIENPFSFTVMLRPVGADKGVPIGWEMDKEAWRSIRSEELEVCFPDESLLLLK